MQFLFKQFNKNTWECINMSKSREDKSIFYTDVVFYCIHSIVFNNTAQKDTILKLHWHLDMQFKNDGAIKYYQEMEYYLDLPDLKNIEDRIINLLKDSLDKYSIQFDILKKDIKFTDQLPVVFTVDDYIKTSNSIIKKIYLNYIT